MPVAFGLEILAINSIAGAAPVDYPGAKISFPVAHPALKGRYGTQSTVTLSKNEMIAPGYTNNVALGGFLHTALDSKPIL
jgi:hypothetical protein